MSPETIGPNRLPPQNLDAERSVLGSMLRDNDAIDVVAQILRAESFYLDAHRKIFQAISDLRDKGGQPVDLVILDEELMKRGQLEDVGSSKYLAVLWDAAPTAANAEYYAKIVRDKGIIRSLIHAGTEILRDAYDQGQPAEELLEGAERKILDVAQMGVTGQTITLEQAITETYRRIDDRASGKQKAGGLSTGFVDLNEITAGLHDGELVIIAARPSVGKCLAHDSEILLEDGTVTTIADIYNRRRARLLTLREDWQLAKTEPSAYVDDGLKPVYRVTTRLGRTIESTLSHPFRTLSGWRPVAELKPGDRIAVPRRLPLFGRQTLRECAIKLLAYLIGDGCLTDATPEFTNGNPRLREEFTTAVREFGGLKVREEAHGNRTPTLHVASDLLFIAEHRREFGRRLRTALEKQQRSAAQVAAAVEVSPSLVYWWCQGACVPTAERFRRLCLFLDMPADSLAPQALSAIRKTEKNPLTLWLQELGLWGKGAHGKYIPSIVFRLPRPQLALFLNRLFATDGWATLLGEGQTQLGYASVSERLTRQIQHLLLRFGIIASLRRRLVKYKQTRREAWQLDIVDQASIATFAAEIGMFGKEASLVRVLSALQAKKAKTCRDTIPPAIWEQLDVARGLESWSSVARRAGLGGHTNIHVGQRGLSRPRLTLLAMALQTASLLQLAQSDVYWDEIVSIESTGLKQVYDLTIPQTHNFIANDICVHNTAFSLAIVRNVIVEEKEPVFFVSLEQSRIELAERLLCAQARVDSHRMRKGTLSSDDMDRLIDAGGVLRGGKLFIDDSPVQSMLRIAANARRLKLRHGIKLIVVDYLQLIEPDNRRDPRQEQVAQISRRLKAVAKELQVPVLALAQVNRASEDRQDHRPRLADLRESGCLTGDSLVTLADTGERVPIRELVGKSGFPVWALDELTMKLKPAEVSNAFATGRKPVFRLTTRLGRSLRATANHRFRSFAGWCRLDELRLGDRIALPRVVPCGSTTSMSLAEAALLGHLIGDGCTLPRHAIQYTTREEDLAQTAAALAREVFGDSILPRIQREREWFQVYLSASEHLTHGKRNPIAAWLEQLGIFGLRSWEKYVPASLFRQPAPTLATFLRHLWATDGCIRPFKGSCRYPSLYYASSSKQLALDVQSLLLRLGINGVLRRYGQGTKGRPQYHVMVMGQGDLLLFMDIVGAVGSYKSSSLELCRQWTASRISNTNRDIIPRELWRTYVVPAMQRERVTMRQLQNGLGMAFMGTGLYKQNVSRERLTRIVSVLNDKDRLAALAQSDVYWDQVLAIDPDGEEYVYDLTVPGPSNFVAEDIIVHNSIEQDADTVMLLHRPDRYEPGQHEGIVEVIIGKQRNGPTGEITLAYLKQYMRYEDYAPGTPFDS